jgi:hypothetical protein
MSLFSAPKIVFQPCAISACIFVGGSLMVTDTKQTRRWLAYV